MALAYPERTWTYEDLLALPDEGKRYEIIEGELFEMTGPNGKHVWTVVNLNELLLPYVKAMGGNVVLPIAEVFMRGADPVQPDLFAILPGGQARLSTRGFEGPPDLVVEVLSPSNRSHDTRLKRNVYGRAGVREYWIVDPEARTVEVLALHRDELHRTGLFFGETRIASPLLPEAAFTAADVFAGLDDIIPAPDEP